MNKIKLFLTAAAVLLSFGASRVLAAASAPETTITGMAVCAKCVLHETKECQNVLQIQKDGKRMMTVSKIEPVK